VVLDSPYLEVPVEEIRDISSLLTMVNGNIVYATAPFANFER